MRTVFLLALSAFLLATSVWAATPAPVAPGGGEEAAKQRMEAYWAEVRRAPRLDDLRALLERGDFAAVERWLESLQIDYEEGRTGEYFVFHAFQYFGRAELGTHVARWVEARPNAWTARSARGIQSAAKGFGARGEKAIRETSPEQIAAMHEQFERAVPDLQTAIAARPRLMPAYARLIDIARANGNDAGARAAIDAALAVDPRSYLVRVAYMNQLEPRWGGSWEAMDSFAREAQAHAADNPFLIMLLGFAAADRGYDRVLAGDRPGAIERYDEALRFARRRDWLNQRADALTDLDRCREARADLEEILLYQPDDAEVLARRARCLANDGQREASLRDYARAFELAPKESWIARAYARQLETAARRHEAAALYERFLAANPEDPDVLEQLALLYRTPLHQPERARDLLAQLVAIAPTRASAWREYGSTLRGLGDPRARQALERYLELAPAHPIERMLVPHVRQLLERDPPPAAMPR